jgi:hypothetical protein
MAKTKLMGMFLQDPSLDALHEDYAFSLDSDYLRGTGSSKIVIRDSNEKDLPIYPGLNWESEADLSFARFSGQGLIDNPQFHQVNTFAALSHTLAFVEQEIGNEITWKARGPLVVRPHAFEGQNAYYYPEPQSLNFGFFPSPFRRAPVWTCLSSDIVVHEFGHAILDTFRPLYGYAGDKDTHALHESLADLLAMFTSLEHPAVVAALYAETGGDMHHPSLISRLAEEFGTGLAGAGEPYLRSALDGPPYDQAPKEAHARSTVWTAAIYDLISRLVAAAKPGGFANTPTGFSDFCATLAEAVRWARGMLLRALHYTSPAAVSMPTLARLVYEADARVFPNDSKFRDLAKQVFIERKLWNDQIDLKAPDIGGDFEDLEHASVAALTRAVMSHAEELMIPMTPGLRLIGPRLVTTTRNCDNVKVGNKKETVEIVEHYLEFAYEQIEFAQDGSTGELVGVSVYGGGTLVMDDQWKANLLVSYPERLNQDPSGNTGAMRAWARGRERFVRVHKAGIQANLAQRERPKSLHDKPAVPGCSVLLCGSEVGAYRIQRRVCNLKEHVNNLRFLSLAETT